MIGSYILWVTLVTQAGDISQHSQVFADQNSCDYASMVEMSALKQSGMIYETWPRTIRAYSINCIPYKREVK